MAAIALSLAVGIAISDGLALTAPIWFGLGVVALLTLPLFAKRLRIVAIATLFVAIGGGVEALHATSTPPLSEPVELLLHFDTDSQQRESGTTANATIVGSNRGGTSARLRIYSDSTLRFKAGERVVARCVIRPFTTHYPRYALMMQRLGFVGYAYLSPHNTALSATHTPTLHQMATERLRSLLPDDEARSVVLSMGTGHRNEIRPETSQYYLTTAAAHLLAVSGLHVGIVCVLLNLLFWPLVLVWRGNVWRSILVVVAIWGYVALCDWSPSATRAALMFSALQLSLFGAYRYNSGNNLCSIVAVLLLISPQLLFDVGFQLSFVAVASIIFWYIPLAHLFKTRWTAVNMLLHTLLVGVTTTLATAPIISYTFGTISLCGIVLNLPLIAIANVVVFCSVGALLLPNPLARLVAECAHRFADWQNAIVEAAATSNAGYYDYSAPWWLVVLLYALALTATILAKGFVVQQTERRFVE